MTDLRDARAAVLTRWHRDLGDNFTAVLPRVLDDLDAADRAHSPEPFLTMGGRKVELTPEMEAEIRARLDAAKDGPLKILPPEPRPDADAILRAAEDRWGDGAYEGPYARQEILDGIREILAAVAGGEVPHPEPPSLAEQVASARTAAPKAPARARRPRGSAAT